MDHIGSSLGRTCSRFLNLKAAARWVRRNRKQRDQLVETATCRCWEPSRFHAARSHHQILRWFLYRSHSSLSLVVRSLAGDVSPQCSRHFTGEPATPPPLTGEPATLGAASQPHHSFLAGSRSDFRCFFHQFILVGDVSPQRSRLFTGQPPTPPSSPILKTCILYVLHKAQFNRLYTGIRALKPKPRSKIGEISESMTALNVDQTNTTYNGKLPSLSPTHLAASVPMKGPGLSRQLQLGPLQITRKDGWPLQEFKQTRKMDARKKSLKRL